MVDLLGDAQLTGSWVVANRDMNRGRGLSGRDGYTRVLGLDVAATLHDRLTAAPEGMAAPDRTVRWLDLCCGRGTALLETVSLLRREGLAARLTGVDLVDAFAAAPPPEVEFVVAPVADWRPEHRFDLITCVHGLHYLGDKLGVLARTVSWLTADGQFVANFDAASIRLPDGAPAGRHLTTALRANGFTYDGRARRISRRGPAEVDFGYRYLGADDRAGPNYTGQPAVHSYYLVP